MTVGSQHTSSRSVDTFGQEWAWADSLGPVFDIEGRTLADFLNHVCREQGWTLAYDDPALAHDASAIVLHGSTSDLQPLDAVAIVLKTSGLTHEFSDGELQVARAARP
jgi:hypothetical protein